MISFIIFVLPTIYFSGVEGAALNVETTNPVDLEHNISKLPSVQNNISHGTNEPLEQLRSVLRKKGIDAYLIPSADEHQSEFVTRSDKRRAFITGFTGSFGTACVTQTNMSLWVDSRYHLQAKRQSGGNGWTILTGRGQNDELAKWLSGVLSPGSKVGVDPRLMSYHAWKKLESSLSEKGNITLVPIKENLVDKVWTSRPPQPDKPIKVYDIKFAGEDWENKVRRIRNSMKNHKVEQLVVSSLDDIAWLFNLRGHDIPITPVFKAYAVISSKDVTLYTNVSKVTPEVKEHLNRTNTPARIEPYEKFWEQLVNLSSTGKVWLPCEGGDLSYAIRSKVPEDDIFDGPSPFLAKAYKNPTEVASSRRAHVKDAVALCELWSLLESQITGNQSTWDELKVSKILEELRSKQALNYGSSFESVVAYGPNAALPHYIPSSETNGKIGTADPLLIDSGGQYLDGTIDTTRVFHFGVPSEEHKDVYTALLSGVIDLATTVFPEGTTLKELDFIIRRPLYQTGRDYGHGSTHGTGVYLAVHEKFNGSYYENFIGSQEPGFYAADNFGMRLENLVVVVPAKVKNLTKKKLLTFEPLTLVPYDLKLINVTQLSESEIKWLNDYHLKVLDEVGKEMEKQGKSSLRNWLAAKTRPV